MKLLFTLILFLSFICFSGCWIDDCTDLFLIWVEADEEEATVGERLTLRVCPPPPGAGPLHQGNFYNEPPMVSFCGNFLFQTRGFYYGDWLHGPGYEILDKDTALIEVPKKAVSSARFCGIGRLSPGPDSKHPPFKPLYILYPEVLELDKGEASVGEEVTVSSERPFFDETTFREEKWKRLCDMGYFIVWLSGEEAENGGVDKALATVVTPEKRPLPKEYYVEVTPTSVRFRVPEWVKSGKVDVINEHGFTLKARLGEDAPHWDPPIVTDEEEKDAYLRTSVELKIK